MTDGFSNPIIGGGGALVYPAIKSPNFQLSPLTGWSIDKNGNAYFESVTIGGGVVRVTFASSAPSSPNTGDVWFDLAAGAQPNVWNGSSWTAYTWGTSAIGADAITTALIAAGAVGTSEIASGAVTTALIAADAITTALIAAGAVGTTEIASGAVTSTQIAAAAAILGTQLASGTITNTELDASVTARSLGGITTTIAGTAPGSPVTGDIWIDSASGYQLQQWSGSAWVAVTFTGSDVLASGSVTATQIANATITATQLAASVTARSLGGITTTIAGSAPGSPVAGDIWIDSANGYQINQYSGSAWVAVSWTATDVLAAASIDASLIVAATITGSLIAAGTITASNIQANTITASQIASGTITAAQIASGTITATQIDSGTITTTQIAAGTILAANIASGTITASQIASGTITASQIATGTIVASNIAAGVITGSLIAATTIAASNIISGTITATQIASGTITGTQIAASVALTSPAITGGTITGGTIIADGTSGQILVYTGAPAAGNLIASVSGASGTDGDTNKYLASGTYYAKLTTNYWVAMQVGGTAVQGLTTYFATSEAGTWATTDGSSNPMPSFSIAFLNGAPIWAIEPGTVQLGTTAPTYLESSAKGNLQFLSATDGNTYGTGRLSLFTTGTQNITSTTPATITGLSAAVGATTYRIHGCILCLQGGGSDAQVLGFSGPGTSACFINTWSALSGGGSTGETFYPNKITSLTGVTTTAFTAGDNFVFWFDGLVTFSGAGTFAVTGAQGVSTHNFSTLAGSFCDLMPVT